MVYCVAYNCKNGSFKNQPNGERVAFFAFPEKNALRKIWIGKIKRKNWKPSKGSKLCSKHFEDKCFEQNMAVFRSLGWTAGRLTLKKDAIPTIFNFSNSSTETRERQTRPAFAKRQRLEACVFIVQLFFR